MKLHETKTHIWYAEYAYNPVTGAPTQVGLFRRRKTGYGLTAPRPPVFLGKFNSEEAARAALKHDETHL